MARLLHLSRPNRGVSKVVWAWLAARQQKRRRQQHAEEAVQMPIVTLWEDGFYPDHTWFDVGLAVEVDLWGWPEASIEIWADVAGAGYHLVDVVASSTTDYVHVAAATGEATILYKSRYRSPDGVLGPFSEEVSVQITV